VLNISNDSNFERFKKSSDGAVEKSYKTFANVTDAHLERDDGRLALFGDRPRRAPRGLDNPTEPATRHF